MSKTLLKMVSFVEAEILQGTAGVCLQGEIEMLVFNIALISQSTVNEQIAWYVGVFFPLAITYVFTCIKRTIRIQCTNL